MIRSEGKYIHSNEDIFMILFVSPWNQATLVHTRRLEGLFFVVPAAVFNNSFPLFLTLNWFFLFFFFKYWPECTSLLLLEEDLEDLE